MSDECWRAAAGIAGTVVGVFIGAWLSRKTSQDLLAQQAKAEFSATFIDTLVKLHAGMQNSGEGDAVDILKDGFSAHFSAYLKLRAVIPKKQQPAIDKAWKHYADEDEKDLPEERPIYRFAHVLDPKLKEHQNLLAIKHVNRLLDAVAT
jgi:hypothetical protein